MLAIPLGCPCTWLPDAILRIDDYDLIKKLYSIEWILMEKYHFGTIIKADKSKLSQRDLPR